jgi:histidinol-phosphate/aromatic aminotransferase/cobyric acid decarboxylase-like protein
MSCASVVARVAALKPRWSVNGFAHDFFIAALKEVDYFEELWATAPKYRAEMITILKNAGLRPKEDSPA